MREQSPRAVQSLNPKHWPDALDIPKRDIIRGRDNGRTTIERQPLTHHIYFKYLGGLPVGNPGDWPAVEIRGNDLHFEWRSKKPWSYDLPLASVSGLRVESGEQPDLARMALVGILAFAWKKKEHYLILEASLGGLSSPIVLFQAPQHLNRLRQEIMQAFKP